MIVYYLRTGYMHRVTRKAANRVIKYYKLFNDHGVWRNKRGTICAWEVDE